MYGVKIIENSERSIIEFQANHFLKENPEIEIQEIKYVVSADKRGDLQKSLIILFNKPKARDET